MDPNPAAPKVKRFFPDQDAFGFTDPATAATSLINGNEAGSGYATGPVGVKNQVVAGRYIRRLFSIK